MLTLMTVILVLAGLVGAAYFSVKAVAALFGGDVAGWCFWGFISSTIGEAVKGLIDQK